MKLKLEIALQKELPTTRSFSSLASLGLPSSSITSQHRSIQNRVNEEVRRLCWSVVDGVDGITIAIA